MKSLIPSFRIRIALLSAAISGVVLVGFGVVVWVWVNRERVASLDREIRALAYRHPGWMNNRANYERLGSAIEFIFGEDRKNQLILVAMDARGDIRFRSAHWPREIDPASLDLALVDDPGAKDDTPGMFTKIPRFLTVKTPATSWRLGILGNAQNRLVVGLDGAEMQAELGRMRDSFLVTLPIALAVIGVGGWCVAGHAIRPLRSIARAAEQTTARGLDQRIPVSGEDPEMDGLIEVLNRMMDRLQASFRQAIRFSADASHELKTPLAVMQGELEQALQSAEDGSRHQRVYASLLDETQRLKTITRSLLLLAQADSGHLPLSPESVALSDDLEDIAADARILAEGAELELEARIVPGVVVSADRVLLRLALSNLLNNAIQYNRPGGQVRLELEATGDVVRVQVSNTGPGIPSSEQAHVFDRFHRGNEARSRRREGIGLGLSLAREIVLAHRGDLSLAESGPAWTVFRLTLPRLHRTTGDGDAS